MKGSQDLFLKFIGGYRTTFYIPVYQRNYNWEIDNCKRLYDDLIKVNKSNLKSHFFGCVVSQYLPSGKGYKRTIIDGQQRLTTVSLLLLAMRHIILDEKLENVNESYAEELYESYIINKWENPGDKIKLIPAKNDRETYKRIVNHDQVDGTSHMVLNYLYFYERLLKREISIEDLYGAINKLEIINIDLEAEDDAQLIFESLNSTGLDLAEGDKIRNYILMDLSDEEQEDYYEQFWNPIEENTSYQVDEFIRHYLSIKNQKIPVLNKIYATFKDYAEQNKLTIKKLLVDLKRYSNYFKILTQAASKNKALNKVIRRLDHLETSVTYPFFFEVLRLNEENMIDDKKVVEVFECIESYVVRRMLCNVPTNAMNKMFVGLHREIMTYDSTANDYVKKLYYCLLVKKENVRFPDDEELKNSVRTRDVYNMKAKNKVYLLERFENQSTLEDKDVYSHVEDKTYSIEHIMPQNLTEAWKEELGSDYQNIHDTWVHRAANLTFTAYNSKYSNRSFEEKKTMPNGYLQSGIRMNQWIAKNDHWGVKELKERSKNLEEEAVNIWKYPERSYVPDQKKKESYTLKDSEVIDFTGKKLARYRFLGTEYSVRGWMDMIENVVRDLYFREPELLIKLSDSANEEFKKSYYLSDKKVGYTRPVEIENGIYLEQNTSTITKCKILSLLLQTFKIDESKLEFFFYDDQKKKDETLQDKVYKAFWKQALPKLKEAFPTVAYAIPKNKNYFNIPTGIKGIFLGAVLNKSLIRVSLHIEKSKKEENKLIFDNIFAHKEEIEKELKTAMIWDRGDKKITSQISITLDLSISDLDHWDKIVDFMNEWFQKLNDQIVNKYLKNS